MLVIRYFACIVSTILTFFHHDLERLKKFLYFDKDEHTYQKVLGDYLLNNADTEIGLVKNMQQKTWLESLRITLSELSSLPERAGRWGKP